MTQTDAIFELAIVLRVRATNLADAIGAVETRLTSGRTDAAQPESDARQVRLQKVTGQLAPKKG